MSHTVYIEHHLYSAVLAVIVGKIFSHYTGRDHRDYPLYWCTYLFDIRRGKRLVERVFTRWMKRPLVLLLKNIE
jgi:hypothetical protein